MLLKVLLLFVIARANAQLIKVDCHPDPNSNQQNCQARGCVWQSSTVPNEPWCYFDPNNFAGYDLTETSTNTSSQIKATLQRRNTPTIFGNDHNTVLLSVDFINDNYLRISLSTPSFSKPRHAHAEQKEDRINYLMNVVKASSNAQYKVQIQNQPFGIKVIRTSTNQPVFDTTGIAGLTIEDQFVSLTTRTASTNVYGFDEQVHQDLKQFMNWTIWGMFSRDEGSGGGSQINLYGVHNFFLCVENGGNAYGVYFDNANAQHVELAAYPTVTYRSIGGILDFHIFLGPKPADVIQQYQSLIGFPKMPPYWSLGFHLCRYGYANLNAVQTVWKRNQQAGIPQDGQWIDIDYMNSYMDFTYDTKNFNGLPGFAQTLHSSDYKLVLITDPCIASSPPISYPALTDGLNSNVFIIDPRTNKPLQAKVWPGNCYFPDFTNPNATPYWTTQVKNFHDVVNFDGLWIDMNEPSNFDSGSATGCANNKWNNPPFVPLQDTNIYDKTICMDAVQYTGIHYDLHSLYGYYESASTRSALESVTGQRSFVLTRSTYPGSGKQAAHWTGDNNSQWPDLKWSIITCLEFNFFGIPFVGADICGFNDASNEELCTRWMQLGAFYPFSRNHNSIGQPDQDPAIWSSNSIQSSKNALTIRYKLLPHLNTLLQQAHTNGSTVMRPLFFEFPTDSNTYDIYGQFLWGSGFMIVPVITQGATSVNAYFPVSRWFSYTNGAEIANPNSGRSINVQIGLYDLPGLYVRGGTIIPWQTPMQTTVQSRGQPFGLLVALDSNQAANGILYWDDGTTIDADTKGLYSFFTFQSVYKSNQYGILTIQRTNLGYVDTPTLNTIQVFGMYNKPTKVSVNGGAVNPSQIQYDTTNNAMTVTGLNLNLFSATATYQIQWNYF